MAELQGVYVVMVTPFAANGDVDHEGIRKNISWWISEGVHGLIALGSTGEFASLNDVQKMRVTETVMDAVQGRIPVVVGASAETTEKAIENARAAQEAGASGVLVLPPWYYTPSQEEIIVHYRRIAEAIDIPIMIYNNPFSSKVDIKADTVGRLAKVPNIRYIKESTGDIKRITEIRVLTDDGISVFCGWEDMAYESFVMGAKGWVCVIGNIAPNLSVKLFDSVVILRDYAKGWEIYKRMLPMLRYLEYAGKIQKILKHALDTMGLCGGYSSSPKLPLEEEDKKKIEKLVKELRTF
jgi:4-hydroxy-tetrahydrodipicolinate synthase